MPPHLPYGMCFTPCAFGFSSSQCNAGGLKHYSVKGSKFYLFGLGAHDPMSPQRLQSHALMNPAHRYQLKICSEHRSANQTTSMCARNSSPLRGFVGNRVRRSVGRREHRNLALLCVRLPPPNNNVLMSYFKGNATPKKNTDGQGAGRSTFSWCP